MQKAMWAVESTPEARYHCPSAPWGNAIWSLQTGAKPGPTPSGAKRPLFQSILSGDTQGHAIIGMSDRVVLDTGVGFYVLSFKHFFRGYGAAELFMQKQRSFLGCFLYMLVFR